MSGLLTGAMTKERIAAMPDDDFRKRTKNFQEPNLSRNLALFGFAEADRRPPLVSARVSSQLRGRCTIPQ